MANIASNRSPSPLSSRNCRNSETNSTTRRSFSGNPFARPNAFINPRSLNPPTPANSPATTDHTKRHSIGRKSIGNSMFQEGKENHRDAIRSPARGGSKNFMAPTISAASKFTPSPRKTVLGEKNDLSRTSIQFLDKDSDLKSEATPLDRIKMDQGSHESKTLEQKELVLETPPVHEVTLSSMNVEATEMLSEVTEISDFVNAVESCPTVRPFCCSPETSPIIAPLDADPSLPPYDPKKNFLSPRPQFLRYKPNPRIEILLNKVEGNDDYGEEDVTRFEDNFNLSENPSDTEVEEEEEAQLGNSVHGSSEDLSEMVSEEKQPDSKVKKASKPKFFTRSKTISLLSLMFLAVCFSVSFTDSPPMDLSIYKDVSFSEIYHESLKFATFAKESFDDFVENLRQWSTNLASYISQQKSHFSSTHKISSIQFFNLTSSPLQEEFLFNRHIGTDYIDCKRSEIQEFEEEMEDETETIQEAAYQEMEVDDDIDVADEVVTEEPNEIQPHEHIQSDDDDFLQTKLNLEDGSNEIASISASRSEAIPEAKSDMVVNGLEDGSNEIAPISASKSEAMPEPKSEMMVNDLEIESSLADSNVEVSSVTITQSETFSSLSTRSITTICFAGFSMVMVAASAIFYMNKRKSSATTATLRVAEQLSRSHEPDVDVCRESCSSGMSSVQKGHKKKSSNNKRESLASSSSDLSMGSPSYGSFTTYERIPIKHGDEVMLTPIRRSSRLLKNQVTSS